MHIAEQKLYYRGPNLFACAAMVSLVYDALLCSLLLILPRNTAFS
jgi:hypothetical protein